jgi:hypothetical protein
MRKWLIIIGLLLLLFVAGYFAVFKFMVPKVAASFMPVKWQNIPLGQKRTVLLEYLGTPDSSISNNDHWQQKINEMKKYVLDVKYNEDSVAVVYNINYEVDLLGFVQRTQVLADSLK